MSMPMLRYAQSPALRALTALALSVLCACATAPEPTPAADFAPVRERLAGDCAAGRFSGTVEVRQRGRTLFAFACGQADIEARTAIVSGDRFKLFSLSKPLTATAILRLVERGRLELDAPIARYVPATPAAWSDVTVRHLLQHRSAVPDLTERLLGAYRAGERVHETAMDRLLSSLSAEEARLAGPPGEQWRYSNFGYELLAQAAAKAEGRPFAETLRSLVLRPAGMRTAAVDLPDEAAAELRSRPIPRLIQGYVGRAGEARRATSYSFVQQGAGAVVAGASDLFAFAAALRGERLLSAEMKRRNVADSVAVNETVRYGYGWLIRRVGRCTYWQHSGGNNGFVSDFAYAPDQDAAVVILSNLGFAEPTPYRNDIMARLLEREGCSG